MSYLDGLTDLEAKAVGRLTSRLTLSLRSELDVDFVHSMVAGMGVAHVHQHVFVRLTGTTERYAQWLQLPETLQGDIPTPREAP